MGGQIDYEKVAADRDELVKAVKAGTDRDDLDVGEPTWLLETRQVLSHDLMSSRLNAAQAKYQDDPVVQQRQGIPGGRYVD